MSVLMCVGTHVPGRSLRFAVFTLPSRQTGGDGTARTISCNPTKPQLLRVSSQPGRSWYGPASPVPHVLP